MNRKISLVKRLIIAYIVLISVCTLLVIVVHCIPQSFIKENVVQSIHFMEREGVYPKVLNLYPLTLDVWTDAMMLNCAISADDKHPIDAAMTNICYVGNDDVFHLIEKVAQNETQGLDKIPYGRYWHGYQIILRPLLIFISYPFIRLFNYILLTLLAVYLFIIFKKRNSHTAYMFLATLLLVSFPIVPCTMQFSTCFYIALLSMIGILKYNKLTSSFASTVCLFFIIGGVTSYFDFLTTPQITLGFPLITYFLDGNKKQAFRKTLILAFIWGVGYTAIWSSKWLIATCLTNQDILANALTQIEYRAGGTDDGGDKISLFWFVRIIWEKIVSFQSGILIYLGLAFIGITLFLYLKSFRNINVFKNNIHYLLIAAIVPVWFFCIRNHSLQHLWFTWRAFGVTLFSLMIFIYNTTDIKKLRSLWSRVK